MKIMKNFRIIYLFQYALMASLMTQLVPFLTHIGYDSIERGWLLASYSLTTVFFQISIGYLSDRMRGIKKFYQAVIGVLSFFSALLFLFTNTNFFLHLLVVALCGGLTNTSAVLIDNWIISNNEVNHQISSIKALGSLGWGLTSIIIPMLIINGNYHLLALWIFVNSLIVLITTQKIEEEKSEDLLDGETITLRDIIELCRRKNFIIYIIIFFLIYLTIVANNTLIIDKLLTLPDGSKYVGLKWAVQSFFEIPAYFIFNRFIGKIKNEPLLIISAFFLLLQFIFYYFSSTAEMIILSAFLQFLTVPLFSLSSRLIIFEITPKRLLSSGQLISISLYIGLASFVSPLLSGFLNNLFSIDLSIKIFMIFPLMATVIFTISRFKRIV